MNPSTQEEIKPAIFQQGALAIRNLHSHTPANRKQIRKHLNA